MKTRLLPLFTLGSALLLMPPAMAQQGPAGVPGVLLLGAEIAPPPPPEQAAPPQTAQEKAMHGKAAPDKAAPRPDPGKKQAIRQCRKAKNIQRCEERYARRLARTEARNACKTQPQHKRKACINQRLSRPAK